MHLSILYDGLWLNWKKDLVNTILSQYKTIQNEMIENINSTKPILSQSPSEFSSSAWSMVSNISTNIILVLAGLIFAYVMTIELIDMLTQKNNYHEVEVFQIYFWIIKIAIGIVILKNYITIINSIFEIGNWAFNKLVGEVNLFIENSNLEFTAMEGQSVTDYANNQGMGDLLMQVFFTSILSLAFKIIGLLINVVVIGRFFEIYLNAMIGSLAIATLATKDYRNIGINFIKNMFALALQGVLIVGMLAIYISISTGMLQGDGLSPYKLLGFGLVLIFSLFKTKSIAQSILMSH